jgi:hypothetical protein
MLDFPEVAVGNNNNISDDRFDTLLSVVSDLASIVDATQRRLDALNFTASHLHRPQLRVPSLLHIVPVRFLNVQLAPLDMVVRLLQVCTVTCHTYRT